ncbi:DUF6308 family protein [Streptomyces sp. HSW2009]|uniref:DUF6308 family protein n=1 Tax=Streptomyces sp. HSW2009 TaxID=3142890 RepID=UPI0032EB8D42
MQVSSTASPPGCDVEPIAARPPTEPLHHVRSGRVPSPVPLRHLSAPQSMHRQSLRASVQWRRPRGDRLPARKRPRLLPVYDQVVRCDPGRPESFWLAPYGALRADDRALPHSLTALRQSAGLPATVSALRVRDVAAWMRHRGDHRRGRCAVA